VVVVAPDSFKGTFSSAAVARAIAAGLRASGARALELPIADGGDGTLDALAAGRSWRGVDVHDPLGRTITAAFDLDGTTATIEAARAAGLGLVTAAERDPWAASTAGVGELIVAARDAGARTIVVGLGGSATTDGGAGAIAAITAAGGLGAARLELLCDVTTPFELAAAVFGPQKGADAAMVRRLGERLDRQAQSLPRDPRGVPMTGAAGGLAGGLWSAFDARLVPGAAYVLDRLGFDRLLAGAVAVVTGEGRLDDQTASGKAAAVVVRRAAAAGVPVHAVVGANALPAEAWRALGLRSVCEASTLAQLEAAGRRLGRLVSAA
jgi:glycerate kinase